MQDWYKKIFFIPIFIFLISITSVLGIPPFESQTATGINILELRIPQTEFIKQNEDVQLNILVFNKTTGLVMDNTAIGCFLDLYNRTGHHRTRTPFNYDGTDFELDIGGGNFSIIGRYGYIVFCNSTTLGGFIAGSFEVTKTGLEDITTVQNNEDEYFLYFVFILAVLILIAAFYKQDHNLASISGMLQIILGGYIIIAGFSTISNNLSNGIGIILIAVGFYILLRSNLENI